LKGGRTVIAIVDYGLGNLGSIVNMLKKLGAPAVRTSEPDVIGRAEGLILPGVGSFDHGVQRLRELGLVDVLGRRVLEERVPILGLCLGMQLFAEQSEEGQEVGLSWIRAQVRRFEFPNASGALRVPHVGWNSVRPTRQGGIFDVMPEMPPRFYFVHSYHLVCADPCLVAGETTYGYEFAAAIDAGNIWGVQFHPEKSHKFGMQLFRNFIQRVSC
jgi:glutamine amidotransferase